MTSLLPKVSSEHSSQEPSKLSPLSSLSLSLSPPPPLSLLPDLFFLLRISHLFSLRGTQPTPVLSVPILHPCSPHTALWRMQECWLVVCSSRSKSHPFPSSPAPGKADLALWLLVRLGSTQHMQKIGGLENREMGGGGSSLLSPGLRLLSGGPNPATILPPGSANHHLPLPLGVVQPPTVASSGRGRGFANTCWFP